MSPRTLIALVLAIALGGGALYMLIAGDPAADPAKKAETVNVVIAGQLIPAHTHVTPEMLATVELPRENAPDGCAMEKGVVAGSYVDREILKGQVIFDVFYKGVSSDPLRSNLQKGKRAYAVSVDEASGISGLLTPGCRVDLISVLQPDSKQSRPVSTTVLQNVTLLAAGSQVTVTADADTGDTRRYRTVTLELTPDQVETVNIVVRDNSLSLALRADDDLEEVETPGKTLQEVVKPRSVAQAGEDVPLLASLFGAGLQQSPAESLVVQELRRELDKLKKDMALVGQKRSVAVAVVPIPPVGPRKLPWRIEVQKGSNRAEVLFETKDSKVRVEPGQALGPISMMGPTDADMPDAAEAVEAGKSE